MKTLLQPEQKTLVFSLRRPTFSEAKQIVRGKCQTMKDYDTFRQKNPQYFLPSVPKNTYKTEWVSVYDFLPTAPLNRSESMKNYWKEVALGLHKRKPYIRKPKATNQSSAKAKAPTMTTLEEKQLMISLFKKYGIYEQCKPAIRSLFTIDELLETL